jgi:hypothetical protein
MDAAEILCTLKTVGDQEMEGQELLDFLKEALAATPIGFPDFESIEYVKRIRPNDVFAVRKPSGIPGVLFIIQKDDSITKEAIWVDNTSWYELRTRS